MNHPVIPIAVQGATRQRKREAPKGRRVDPAALQQVQALLGEQSRRRDMLIEHLHKIQDSYGCLSAAHLAALAQEMRLAQTEVYEVATFYHHFDVLRDGEAAPAALTVRVCDGLSCELAGAQDLLARLPAILGTEVRVIGSPCIGRCEQAPAVLVGQHPVPHATVEQIAAKVGARETTHTPEGYADFLAYREGGGYRLLRECVAGQRDVEAIIATLEASGLRGLGGAGFPAGRKWRIVRSEPGPRLMAINIDEGEPGTFKDRVYLERDPHRFIEGALVAAWAVGIETIYIYLRDEYHGCRAMLEAELEKLRADPPVQGMPEIVLRRGAGAYICGEETALLESIEGKRGVVRAKPPLPALAGLFGQPTVINNVLSLASVPIILDKGAQFYQDFGMGRSRGTLPVQLAGNIKNGGLIELAFGATLREILYDYGGGSASGRPIKAVQVGGPLGAYLPESQWDTPLDYEAFASLWAVLGHGGIVVHDDSADMARLARYAMEFCAVESCGKCTPCRIGSTRGVEVIDKIRADVERPQQVILLRSLCDTMLNGSLCAMGGMTPYPVLSALNHFPEDFGQVAGGELAA